MCLGRKPAAWEGKYSREESGDARRVSAAGKVFSPTFVDVRDEKKKNAAVSQTIHSKKKKKKQKTREFE